MGDAILSTILESLVPFDDETTCGPCAGLDGFVAHGDPALPFQMTQGAFVAVYLQQFGPTSTSAGGAARNATPGSYPITLEASWRIELREMCYPGPEGEQQPIFPSAERLHETNRHLYAHGYTAYTSLVTAWRNGTLFPHAVQCPVLRFGSMLPIAPQAYSAGWTWDVSGEVP